MLSAIVMKVISTTILISTAIAIMLQTITSSCILKVINNKVTMTTIQH